MIVIFFIVVKNKVTRSIWKPTFNFTNLPVSEMKETLFENNRRAWVLINDIGNIKKVHNGRKFVHFRITRNMVGFKLGQFTFTKKKVRHRIRKKRKK